MENATAQWPAQQGETIRTNLRPRTCAAAIAIVCCWAAQAQAPTAPPPAVATTPVDAKDNLQRVEVLSGRVGDTDERRQSTAAKIVIGREEIEAFGDSTVGEVLRRLPGVTTPGAPGRGGAPRMRGLGSGYTQLLLDGQRVPPGFSLESLTPDQIERIEILRAPTAETGARGIAGTINIVLRETYRRRVNDLRLGLGVEDGRATPSLSWTRNDSIEALTYNVSGTVYRSSRSNFGSTDTLATDLGTGAVLRDSTGSLWSQDRRQGLNLSSRLQWRLGPAGDTLTLMPSIVASDGTGDRQFTQLRRVVDPRSNPDDDYDFGTVAVASRSTALRLNGQWRQRLGSSRLELSGGVGQLLNRSDSHREEFRTGGLAPLRNVDDSTDTRDRSARLTAKLSTLLGGAADGRGAHSLVSGLEVEALRRTETRSTLQDGLPLLTDFGDDLEAASTRLAAYAQDEWSLGPHWAFHAGLRWEGIMTRGAAEGGHAPRNRSAVTTPLVHLLWKPDPARRDQLRLSLTRSYRAPSLGTLIARPTLNQRDPVPGANTPTTPDNAGNPGLKPELARGVDLAFERYLPGGGILSANLFHRRIQDLMRRVVAPEAVSWAAVPRWVARQQNIGDAMTQGIELEAKFRLDQALAGAPAVEIKSNLSLYRSSVDGVAGPDNRLDQQARATANLGADYRFRGLPLTLGGNLNWVPGYRTQMAEDQVVSVSTKKLFDAYFLWAISPSAGLRLRASNLAPAGYVATNSIDALGVRTLATTTAPTQIHWQARLELKL